MDLKKQKEGEPALTTGHSTPQPTPAIQTPAAEGGQPAVNREQKLPSDPTLRVNLLCGLAETLDKIGRREPALRALMDAKKNLPNHYLPYLIQGVMHYDNKEYLEALNQLRQAKALNPFHEEICNYLSLASYHSGAYREALEAMIDAYLLSGEFRADAPSTYQQRIKIIVDRIEDLKPEEKKAIFKERQNLFEDLYTKSLREIGEDNLPPATESQAAADPGKAAAPQAEKTDLELLRAQPLFANLKNEQLAALAACAQKKNIAAGGFLFREEDTAQGLYVNLTGHLLLQKRTPFGPLLYREVGAGGILAEEHLLESETHWSDGLSAKGATLLLFGKQELQELFLRDRDLAVHCLWHFWKNLGRSLLLCHLRLLPQLEQDESQLREATPEKNSIDLQKDLSGRLLNLDQKNLSKNELHLLETIVDPLEIPAGGLLYAENEFAQGLHVISAGSVVLSSTDNEVLAILEAGDCCGELSLMGEIPARETARAYSDGTRILLIDRELCSKVMNGDSERSYLFLSLLCRMLSKRLLLTIEKVFQLRMILNSQRLKIG